MRRIDLTMILAGGLAAAAPLAFAEDDGNMQWTGSVTLGLRYSEVDARDVSKFDEYRGLGDGAAVWGGFEFRGRSDTGYFNVYTENLGTDNQYLDLRSGAYGKFKYRLYSDELRHRFGFGPGAISPFSGIGSNVLTMASPTDPNTANWFGFDHSYTRLDQGGSAEWQATSPWYIRVDANQVKREGLNVFAGARGTSPGNGFSDLPVPIDYTTNNFGAEVGYTGDRSHFAFNVGYSSFRNGYDVLRWNNSFFGNGYDTTVLPPDNQLTRLGMEGNMRGLFWNSTLAGRLVYSQLDNSVAVQPTMLFTGGVNAPSNATPGTFNGDIRRTNFALSLSSYPTRAVDTRLYMNYDKEDNKSTVMSFPGSPLSAPCTNPTCTPEMFHYSTTRFGAEGGIRTSRTNRFSGGLELSNTERERIDFDKTDVQRLYVQWKNNALDSLSARIKYQYMTRESEFNDNISLTSGNPMDFYVRRFDYANVDQNLLKLIFDVTPAPSFDLGFEVTLKDNNYKDTILGRTQDQRQEYFVSAGFGSLETVRSYVFGDYEIAKFDSSHRVGTGNPDPSTPPSGAPLTYNWTGKNEDQSWQVGVGTDWKVSPNFTFKGSLIYAKTEGSAEFTPEAGVIPALVPTPFQTINNVDNTTRTALNLTGVYMVDRHWELTGGYAYEKYKYDDIGYTGTRYVSGAGTTASPVTGQYSFQPYDANIVYGMAKYKF